MVRLDLAAVLLAVTAVTRAVTANTPSIVPGAYIVEYEEDQDSNALVNTLGGKATLRKDLRFKLFKGASIQFKDTKNADKMAAKVASMPKIKAVFPVRRYPVPHHVVHSTGDGVQEVLSKRQKGNDTFSTHLMTQVNQFRDAGVTGKGIKIGIIDTGTDYLHPALGGCFGEGCLVSYGTDLVGDAFNGANTPKPDADPLDNCNGHGTHVAGIIAAQSNNPYGIIGAAQDVTLGSYRVFGCTGDVGNDILIAAYNMAYEDGSDIITASIGGPSGWSEDPWAAVVSRIVENGVPCVVSAGNDGALGIFYASTAANGDKVTAIASVDNMITPALLSNGTFSVDGTDQSFGFTTGEPGAWTGVSLPLWAVNFDTADPANGCDPYPESTPDLSGHIVLIRRGSCTFVQKVENAAAKGAKYVLFYNNAVGTALVSAPVDGVAGVAMVTAEQGKSWIRALEAKSEVVVNMEDAETAGKFLAYFNNTATAGFLSDFTSWGPTFEVEVKPQFSTPGGMILSTYPRALGSYGVLSGTSMACPMAAAVYALLMNVRGTKDPKTLENVLSATAHPNLFRRSGESLPLLAPVPQQGGGLIQAWDAAHATTLLSVSSLSFNDTDHFNPVHNFSISNTGKTAITYSLSNVGAATAYTFRDHNAITPSTFPSELTADFASLSFSPESFTIPAGQRKIVTVTATAPKGLDEKRLPVYSGYITINGTDGSGLSLPYIGVAGSMHSAVVLDASGTLLSRASDNSNTPVPDNLTFVLPPPGFANDTSYRNRTERPKLVATLAMGSALVRADVVPMSNCTTVARNAGVVFGTKTIGQPEGMPSRWNPRGTFEYKWDGKLDDGTYAPPGLYKFAVKALRIFGDPKVGSEYDQADTLTFRIKYLPGPSAKLRRQDQGGECEEGKR
ncbi:minor extracellular protease [Chaetomidium leptoderma]|uniref:Minor extracellular protease n=1 Tax=Chaetomidium leptoderma TaxID=669021 RepID=A0AAN6ZVY8_9PEZI|nr:minor extracellular protease [Chaetomidium leptoderma]